MYRTYESRWWYGGLYRKDYGTKGSDKKRVYLSDAENLEGKIIIAKPVDLVYVTSPKQDKVKTIYNYTCFKDYVEFYHYIKHTNCKDRIFHEVTPEHVPQKARFDVDIERDKYEGFVKILGQDAKSTSFAKFGNYVKDLVIRNVIQVLKEYGLTLDLSRDVCVFTCHRSSKRSYHIVINRYFHYGSVQAQEFQRLCLQKCASQVEIKLFKTFIDPGIYDKNHPLRTWHSVKKEQGVCYEKKFSEEFTFEGLKYTHQLVDEAFSEEEDDEVMSDKIRKLHILHRSLITYTHESVPLPSFPVTKIDREQVSVISGETYKECCQLISAWDPKGIFTLAGEEDGQIHLLRNSPSLCEICRPIRESAGVSAVHDSMNAFCYIHRGHLYWHCYRAKGHSGICLGKLKSYRSESDRVIDDYLKTIVQEEGCRILEEDGTEYHPEEDASSYEDEVIRIAVDSESASSDTGESFSDDALDDLEDISFTKVTVIASNKLEPSLPLFPVKRVTHDGTDSFLLQVSTVPIPVLTVPIPVLTVPIPVRTVPIPVRTEVKSRNKLDPAAGKGKDKESDFIQPFNFAQSLRQQSKSRVKYISKQDVKLTTKVLIESFTKPIDPLPIRSSNKVTFNSLRVNQ
jgi:hypothetical protein